MKKPMLIVLASLAATSLAFAEDPPSRPEDSGVNLLFTLTIADQSRDGEMTERSVRLLTLNGRPAKLLTGWRYPIPTTRFNTSSTTGTGAIVPITSYSYQDVGVAVSLKGWTVSEDRIRVEGRVEVSAVKEAAEPAGSTLPKVGTFSHEFDVILTDGVEEVLAEAPRPDEASIGLAISGAIR